MFNLNAKSIRRIFLLICILVVCGGLYATDPDEGLSTLMMCLNTAVVLIAVGLSHVVRKAIFHNDEADVEKLLDKASETSTGSGLALLAISIILATLLFVFGTKVHAATLELGKVPNPQYNDLPTNATKYVPVLRTEQRSYWKDHTKPELLAGLVEQESCPSLKSRSCWSPLARLKTSREEGAGVGQITRAYNSDGSIRFDALAALRRKYNSELNGWSWSNVYSNPVYQFRALVLMAHDNYQSVQKNTLSNGIPALAFADASYNGGFGGLQSDRRMCKLKKNCDPQLWFNNVELTCSKSHLPLYGTQSACDINRAHVRNVINLRSEKYKEIMNAA